MRLRTYLLVGVWLFIDGNILSGNVDTWRFAIHGLEAERLDMCRLLNNVDNFKLLGTTTGPLFDRRLVVQLFFHIDKDFGQEHDRFRPGRRDGLGNGRAQHFTNRFHQIVVHDNIVGGGNAECTVLVTNAHDGAGQVFEMVNIERIRHDGIRQRFALRRGQTLVRRRGLARNQFAKGLRLTSRALIRCIKVLVQLLLKSKWETECGTCCLTLRLG
jgi:hypothetical protein